MKCYIKENGSKKENNNDSVLHQTIRFAKNLVPLVIPPSDGSDQVFYTIKTCTKCKKKDHDEENCEKLDDATFEKKKSKKLIETFKRQKKTHRDNFSTESATQSSISNTLDDSNINQSLSCTTSELSDKREKCHKNTEYNKRKKRDSNMFRISESFEGLATELNDAGDTKIKIHLMTEKEKKDLSESIQMPIINAVNDCVKNLNDTQMKNDIKAIQELVIKNSKKLDSILDRLACIENHLSNEKASPRSPNPKARKPSRLEQIGEDILHETEYSSEEEMPKRDRQSDGITVLMHRDKKTENLGCGELLENKSSTSVGVRTERNRLPARFCWTDAGIND